MGWLRRFQVGATSPWCEEKSSHYLTLPVWSPRGVHGSPGTGLLVTGGGRVLRDGFSHQLRPY